MAAVAISLDIVASSTTGLCSVELPIHHGCVPVSGFSAARCFEYTPGNSKNQGILGHQTGSPLIRNSPYSSVGVNAILPVAGDSLSSLNTLCQDHNNVQKTVRITTVP
jgi:hypothetical protein